MTIDVSNLKPGDRVRRRDGVVVVVEKNDGSDIPIKTSDLDWYYPDGSYNDADIEDYRDIVEILGPEPPANQWPTPITDREPTEADADEAGFVQVFDNGTWFLTDWAGAAHSSISWQHTPRWQPPAPPTLTPEQQEALAALDRLLQHCSDNTGEAALRRFILREAGE